MAALSIQVPYPVFYDRDGQPLENGNIYIGVANLDPVTNPLQVYYDEALTITASQPLKTSGGYVYRNGTPTQLYVNATDFSITVNDSKNLLVYNFPEATGVGVNASAIAFTGFKGQVGTVADLADADGSNWIGYTPVGTGSVARSAQEKMRDIVSVKDFGAIGDGIANDSVAIQAAIDYVESLGGGIVFFPTGEYKCNVVLKSNVTLTSLSTGTFGYIPGAFKGVVLKQAAAGFVVDTPAAQTTTCAVVGINFSGLGAGTPGGGVRFQNTVWCAVKQCQFNNFADQAILKNNGFACVFEDILITNALLNRTRATVNGVIEMAGGSDDFLHRVEANAGLLTGVSDANLRVCGIVTDASNCFLSDCVGEFADYGIVTKNTYCRLVNCQADLNRGGGFYCNGKSLYSNCLSLSNGQAASNTYDGFYVAGQGDSFSNCQSEDQSGVATTRYGFNDKAAFLSVHIRNKYVNCTAANYGTAAFYMEEFLGSSPIEPGIPLRTSAAIPDTTGSTFIVLTASTPTTITDFTGGYGGKTIRLLGNVNVTIANNSQINTNISANKALIGERIYRFTYYNGIWFEDA